MKGTPVRKLLLIIFAFLAASPFNFAQSPRSKLDDQLFDAIDAQQYQKAAKLLSQGANINNKDVDGGTLLNFGVLETITLPGEKGDHTKTLRFLLNHHSNVNGKDKLGQTALMQACFVFSHSGDSYCLPSAVKLLLARGADVNIRDKFDNTALMFLAQTTANMFGSNWSESETVGKMLLAHGADLYAKNKEGQTAFDYAKKQDNTSLMRLFKKAMQKSHSAK